MGNQIEEIKKLYSQKKEYKIPKELKEGQEQITVEITPLGLDDIGALDIKEGAPMGEISKNVKELFAKSLSIELEAAGKISFSFMEDLLEAIMDANNFNEKDLEKTGVKKFLEQKRELIKKEKESNVEGTTKESQE